MALVEAKASTSQDPEGLIQKNAAQFLVDIKTRAQGFAYCYEGYLIASQFQDGGKVRCTCLYVDLNRYAKPEMNGLCPTAGFHTIVPSYGEPEMRLEAVIQIQAETSAMRDEYLTSLLSAEATRSAMVDLIFWRKSASQDEIDAHILQIASRLALTEQWTAGQELIRDVKAKEKADVAKALVKFQKPTLDLE